MSGYSVELADLMEHEKVIEQGLATFVEVGNALVAIRDNQKYRAGGYSTFEDYCARRWDIKRAHAYRLMAAAETALLVSPIGDTSAPEPTTEAQVRPLTQLPKEDRAPAWREAVREAGGAVPTAREVQAVVERRKPPKKEHPATYSKPILEKLAEKVVGAQRVLDPFAGTGKVHQLRELAGVPETVGVELEPEWAGKHPDTIQGNALDLPPEVGTVDAIVTSPTYGNRMADHHEAKDDSTRLTYTHTLGRQLSEDNSGAMQWGDEYKEFHRKAWAESIRVLAPGGRMVINIKDHIRGGVKQAVAAWHVNTLMHEFGMELIDVDDVPTKGLAAGANSATRGGGEWVFTFRKPASEAAA